MISVRSRVRLCSGSAQAREDAASVCTEAEQNSLTPIYRAMLSHLRKPLALCAFARVEPIFKVKLQTLRGAGSRQGTAIIAQIWSLNTNHRMPSACPSFEYFGEKIQQFMSGNDNKGIFRTVKEYSLRIYKDDIRRWVTEHFCCVMFYCRCQQNKNKN